MFIAALNYLVAGLIRLQDPYCEPEAPCSTPSGQNADSFASLVDVGLIVLAVVGLITFLVRRAKRKNGEQ